MLIIDETLGVEKALKAYNAAWRKLLKIPGMAAVAQSAQPTTLSVKVADKTALFKVLEDNAPNIDQLHIATVNHRYIASAVLREAYEQLSIFKILERRPGASDPLGLDSLDYLVESLEETFIKLQAIGLNIVKEHNDMHAWLSLRFGTNSEFEAKFTDHLVLKVAVKELELANKQILKSL